MQFKLWHVATYVMTLALLAGTSAAQAPAYTDPEKTDADFAFQGEYVGTVSTDEGEVKIGAQVIALGKGMFRAVSYVGGLPGDGWNGQEKPASEGKLADGVVVFDSERGHGELKDGVMKVEAKRATAKGELKKVHRKSPTLGEEPPEGAVVLFDGTSAEGWKDGRMTTDGLLMQGCTSERTFGSHQLHIEFRLPYQPESRGQGRGNSGIYFQGRYEVQMLDSFGLEGKENECGGIYSVAEPELNMCFPPLSWQTYDAEFTTAKYDDDGKLVANPRITVRHNGVLIHDDVELPGNRNTTAAPLKAGPEPGPVYLQNHSNPVRYRNIWVVPN